MGKTMPKVLFNEGVLRTDSSANRNSDVYLPVLTRPEINEKVYRDAGSHIAIASVGVQREEEDPDKTIELVNRFLNILKTVEAGVGKLEDYMEKPNYTHHLRHCEVAYIWREAILLTSKDAYCIRNDQIIGRATNESQLGMLGLYVFYHIRHWCRAFA